MSKIQGLKGNPKSRRISKTARKGKMAQALKLVQGPRDKESRVRGNKAGKGRVRLAPDHPSRTHG